MSRKPEVFGSAFGAPGAAFHCGGHWMTLARGVG